MSTLDFESRAFSERDIASERHRHLHGSYMAVLNDSLEGTQTRMTSTDADNPLQNFRTISAGIVPFMH